MEENDELKNLCAYKVKKCLQCGAETNPKDESEFFCSNCGAPVLNRCSNYQCDNILDEKAKYCKYCGSPSIFYNFGLFSNSNSFPLNNDINELPF